MAERMDNLVTFRELVAGLVVAVAFCVILCVALVSLAVL